LQLNQKSLFILSLLLTSIPCSFADTSELGIGLEVNVGELVTNRSFDTDQEAYIVKPNTHWENQEYQLRVGLGLSFYSTVWLRFGFNQSKVRLQSSEHPILCEDQTRSDRLSMGEAPQSSDQCIRMSGKISLLSYLPEVAYTYKPYDDLSPVLEVSLGMAHMPQMKLWSLIESIKVKDDEASWVPLPISSQVLIQDRTLLYNRFALGFEKRVFSRWGIRVLTWIKGTTSIADNRQSPEVSYGFSFGIVNYQYVRLF
jgi:hypothetical protein